MEPSRHRNWICGFAWGSMRACALFGPFQECRLRSPRLEPTRSTSSLFAESTEGLFASRGKGTVEDDRVAKETLVITRDVTERLSRFCFELANRRSARRNRPGSVTIVDKSNVFRAFAFMRKVFFEVSRAYPAIEARQHSVDATALDLVRRPWDFDILVTENMFGDILSDLGAGLVGGMGYAPSGRHWRASRSLPAMPRHCPRHRGQRHSEPRRHDPVGRSDAGVARGSAREREMYRSCA